MTLAEFKALHRWIRRREEIYRHPLWWWKRWGKKATDVLSEINLVAALDLVTEAFSHDDVKEPDFDKEA